MIVATAILVLACSYILPLLLKILCDVYVHLIAPKLGRVVDVTKYGEWAVISGASEGIGRGYTLELTKRGINVLIIGRKEEKMQLVVDEVKKRKHKGIVKVCVHDFNVRNDAANKEKFDNLLKSLDVGILINNVGSMGLPENFGNCFHQSLPSPIEHGMQLVDLNIASIVLLTGVLLPQFLAKSKGLIINLSSGVAITPVWGAGVYSATKAFVDFFSNSLRQEVKNTPIIVQTVFPFFVKTKLVPSVAFDTFPSFLAPDAENYAISALNTVELQHNTSGCLQHNIQQRIYRCLNESLPRPLSESIVRSLMRGMLLLEDAYHTKAEKKGKSL